MGGGRKRWDSHVGEAASAAKLLGIDSRQSQYTGSARLAIQSAETDSQSVGSSHDDDTSDRRRPRALSLVLQEYVTKPARNCHGAVLSRAGRAIPRIHPDDEEPAPCVGHRL